MTLQDLVNKYKELHYKYQDGCKASCGHIEVSRQLSTYDNSERHVITCGTYCIGPGRWEQIGSGDTQEEAILDASNTLDVFEQNLKGRE